MNSFELLPKIGQPIKTYSIGEEKFLNCIIIAAFTVIFLICYSSTLTYDYGFSDDYYDIISGNQEKSTEKKILEGRPVYGFLHGMLFFGGMSIEDLRWIRLVSIVGISLLAFGMYWVLVCAQWNRLQSFFVSIILCTTLPLQIYAAWAICFAYPFAAFVSLCAFVLADKACTNKESQWQKMRLTTGAILLQFIAITIYQPVAMFFCVAAAAVILKNDARQIFHRCIRYGIILMIANILGFLTYKMISLWNSTLASKGSLVSDVIGKMKYFWKVIPDVFSFSILSPYHYLFLTHSTPHPHTYNYHFEDGVIKAIAVAIMISGLLLYFVRGGVGQERLLKFVVALFLIPLSMFPLLIIQHNVYGYRTLLAPTSLVIIYTFFAFRGYIDLWPYFSPRLANIIWGIGAFISVFLAAHHVHSYIVVPQVREMEIMRFPLERADLSNVRKIHVLRPISGTGGESLAPLMRFEYGYVSSETDWGAHSMVFHVLREMISDHEHIEVDSEHESINPDTWINTSLIEAPSDTLVIDMRNLPARFQAYRWIDDEESILGKLVSQSVFNIYMDDRFLYYTKDTCSPKDYQARFFLHIMPDNLSDLPENRRQYGHDNYDFDFQNYAVTYNGNSVIYEGKCIAVIRAPNYRDARIVTGQFVPGQGRLWESEFNTDRAEP